ncbi:MAG TPA: hypothetical protein DEQ02_02270 [Ruminococcaceae bacterium]|nr:hypothetical protein [Oscillospiraceae bacterium]
MSKKTVLKLVAFNLGVSFINIFVFSGMFVRINMSGENVLQTALGVMIIVVSVILFFYVNYKILFAKSPQPHKDPAQEREIKTLDDCARAARQYIDTSKASTFVLTLRTIIEQIERFKRKKATIRDILLDRFSASEMSYSKFQSAVDGTEAIMIGATRSFIGRILAFDEEDYEKLLGNPTSGPISHLRQSHMKIYDEYIAYAGKVTHDNEQILIRLDQLILEISKLSALSDGDIADMDAVKEIESLISDTKWYK